MARYILRLDDASEYMDIEKWNRMADLLDYYKIYPIFGIIPQNRDKNLVEKYARNSTFWEWVHQRINKGWIPAMHGDEHRYVTTNGGINPVNNKSEFAGLPYEEQCRKIKAGYEILKSHGITPEIFFAPAHTFDENTLLALRDMTPVRIISDTIAYDVYRKNGFWFVPQQSGRVRRLPFPLVTFCYHSNTMSEEAFNELEAFLIKAQMNFVRFDRKLLKDRKCNLIDFCLRKIYFMLHGKFNNKKRVV